MTELVEKPLHMTFAEQRTLGKSKKPSTAVAVAPPPPLAEPLLVSAEGVAYLDQIIAPPYPTQSSYSRKSKWYKPHDVSTGGRVYSIIFPVQNPETDDHGQGRRYIQFRIVRDNQREFTSDGTALLFVIDKKPYGVIDPKQPMFHTRKPVKGSDRHELMRNLLYNSIAGILTRIAVNPEEYFAFIGKQCGICMICGRELSDEESKRRGYGPVCARIWRLVRRI